MNDERITLSKITDAIDAILSEELPAIPWKQEVLGPVFPKTVTGYICCDSVEYGLMDKLTPTAKAVYTIEIISPNPKGKEYSTNLIEGYAMDARDILRNNERLDGWAIKSAVNKIIFATPSGIANIGVAVMEFEVVFEDE